MIEIGKHLTFADGSNYLVTSKAELDGKTYLFIVNDFEPKAFKIGYLEGNELVIIEDMEVIKQLEEQFSKNSLEFYNKITEEVEK